MGSTSSSLLHSLPCQNPALIFLKPCPETPPPQLLPLPSVSSSSLPTTEPLQLTLNPLQNPPASSAVAVRTDPFPYFDPDDAFPVSLESVICPAVAYANVFFYRPYNVQIVPRDGGEDVDKLVKRFRNASANAGVFYELKRRRFYENPREERKTKAQRAAKVLKRARIRAGGGLRKPNITIHRDPLEEKKRKARLAAKRSSKQKRAGFLQKQKGSDQNSVSSKQKESYISDDDNWDFDVEPPYC